eukprot:2946457-Ditylum_brightwellii.AAC.1
MESSACADEESGAVGSIGEGRNDSNTTEADTTTSALLEMKEREKGRGPASYDGQYISLREQWLTLKKELTITK